MGKVTHGHLGALSAPMKGFLPHRKLSPFFHQDQLQELRKLAEERSAALEDAICGVFPLLKIPTFFRVLWGNRSVFHGKYLLFG